MATEKEERERQRHIDRYNAQKQDDVDLLAASPKLFFAFVPAEHNGIEIKTEGKQRLRHKERQRCGEQRMQKIMKTCPSISPHNSHFTTVKIFPQQGNVDK